MTQTRKRTNTSSPATIDLDAAYRVTLARSVQVGPTWLHPGAPDDAIIVTGAVLSDLGDAVLSATRVDHGG